MIKNCVTLRPCSVKASMYVTCVFMILELYYAYISVFSSLQSLPYIIPPLYFKFTISSFINCYCMHSHVRAYRHTHTYCMHSHAHAYTDTHRHACTHLLHAFTCVHAHANTPKHTHMHAHTHTCYSCFEC